MIRTRIPDDILSAAHERAAARATRDWPEADRLRELIEAAGWRIVDRGTDFALSPIAPPDLADGDRVRHGSSASVPSRLDEVPTAEATVVLLATDQPADLERAIRGLLDHGPGGTEIVVVADDPSPVQVSALEADAVAASSAAPLSAAPRLPIEVSWTSARLGHATATNIGLRRAGGRVVILLDTSLEPKGDFITPLVRALDDPTVAVTGGWGIVSADLRRFDDAPAGDVDAIEGYCQAFRRSDFAARGPLDERFRFYRNLDIWWSLALRDEGEGAPPRRALRIENLPLVRHEHRGYASLPDHERDRQSKRNFYRIIDRFGARTDLLVHPPTR